MEASWCGQKGKDGGMSGCWLPFLPVVESYSWSYCCGHGWRLRANGLRATVRVLPAECKSAFSRTFHATTQKEAEGRFVGDFGQEIKRTYGPRVQYLCVYPPRANAAGAPRAVEYAQCPPLPANLAAHKYGPEIHSVLGDCGDPLSNQGQYFVIVYSIAASRECGYAAPTFNDD